MFYRVASQQEPSALWKWESRVIASLEVLARILRMYRSMPRSHLRVFFSSSVEGLDLLLDRENTGLASDSIPVEHLLHERWRTSQIIGQIDLRQFESELRTRNSVGMGATTTARQLS